MNILLNSFHIAGISVRTTNENGQAAIDIPALWHKFIAENIPDKIPSKTGDEIYCLYIDYEQDHTKPYTTILGCKVSDPDNIPEGMVGKTIAAGHYKKYDVKGNFREGVIFDAWTQIWNSDIPRAFTTDIEVYGTKSQNPGYAEMEIFIALK